MRNADTDNATIGELCNEANLRLGSIYAMAVQIGSESFMELDESISCGYGQGMAFLTQDTIEVINKISKLVSAEFRDSK